MMIFLRVPSINKAYGQIVALEIRSSEEKAFIFLVAHTILHILLNLKPLIKAHEDILWNPSTRRLTTKQSIYQFFAIEA